MKGRQLAIVDQAEDGIRGRGLLSLFVSFYLYDLCRDSLSFFDGFLHFPDGFRDIWALIGP